MATLSNEDQVEEEETWVGKEGVNYRLLRDIDLVSRGNSATHGAHTKRHVIYWRCAIVVVECFY